MSTLANQRSVRARRNQGRHQADPQRREPDRQLRRNPRHHGPQRLRQVHHGLRAGRPPRRTIDRPRARRWLDDQLITRDERRTSAPRLGIFLAMQYPVEVRGRVRLQLPAHRQDRDRRPGSRSALVGQGDERPPWRTCAWTPTSPSATSTSASPAARRSVSEILQMELLKPSFAVLDETDSGLDVDALRIVSEGVNRVHGKPTGCGVMHDHALHPHPALHQARTSCTCSPTATSSRLRAVRNSPTSLRRPATTHTCRKAPIRKAHWHDRFRSDPQPISDSRPENPRPSAGIPRFRRDIAEAAVRDRRGIGLLPHHQRRSAPRRA